MEDSISKNLVIKAIKAKDNSYSPYSKFRVGCSLLTEDGQIYTGKLNELYFEIDFLSISNLKGAM